MDLVKSMQSEIYPRIYKEIQGFHPKIARIHDKMNRIEIKGNDLTQTAVI